MIYSQSDHQQQQIEVINQIEKQIKENIIGFSTVEPVKDFENDDRICLTSLHFPKKGLIDNIHQILDPLRKIEPDHYFYNDDSLHLTVKNIRVINKPPHFNEVDIARARRVFEHVIPTHHQFKVYYYRLLLFPANLALVGTTDPELDRIIADLDKNLTEAGIGDDKIYLNKDHFFSNVTLVRFNKPVSQEFINEVERISNQISIAPYIVDSVTLIKGNATFKIREIIDTWSLTP